MAASKSFKYVYIPTDVSKPIECRELEYNEETLVPCFIDEIKKHLSKIPKAADAAEKRNASVKEALEKKGDANLDLNLINAFSNLSMVGQIPLLSGRKTVEDGIDICMYVDDNGLANGYEPNVRAQQIAAEVRAKHYGPVWGDAFIATTYDDNDKFERHDFTLNDLNSSNPWFQQARNKNTKSAGNVNENLKKLQQTLDKSKKEKKPDVEYQIGDSVIVNGLKSKPHYNGQVGTIKGEYIPGKDRWPVLLLDGAILSVRTSNLTSSLAELTGDNESEL